MEGGGIDVEGLGIPLGVVFGLEGFLEVLGYIQHNLWERPHIESYLIITKIPKHLIIHHKLNLRRHPIDINRLLQRRNLHIKVVLFMQLTCLEIQKHPIGDSRRPRHRNDFRCGRDSLILIGVCHVNSQNTVLASLSTKAQIIHGGSIEEYCGDIGAGLGEVGEGLDGGLEF